jgi:hypothetical protein
VHRLPVVVDGAVEVVAAAAVGAGEFGVEMAERVMVVGAGTAASASKAIARGDTVMKRLSFIFSGGLRAGKNNNAILV